MARINVEKIEFLKISKDGYSQCAVLKKLSELPKGSRYIGSAHGYYVYDSGSHYYAVMNLHE